MTTKKLTIAMTEALESLATKKAQIKTLTAEAKKIESWILDNNPPEKFTAEAGKLSKSSRTNYDSIDSAEYIKKYGVADFKKTATITCSAVSKCHGTNRVEEMKKAGLITIKSISKFFTLRG